jgi:hypothetical protein
VNGKEQDELRWQANEARSKHSMVLLELDDARRQLGLAPSGHHHLVQHQPPPAEPTPPPSDENGASGRKAAAMSIAEARAAAAAKEEARRGRASSRVAEEDESGSALDGAASFGAILGRIVAALWIALLRLLGLRPAAATPGAARAAAPVQQRGAAAVPSWLEDAERAKREQSGPDEAKPQEAPPARVVQRARLTRGNKAYMPPRPDEDAEEREDRERLEKQMEAAQKAWEAQEKRRIAAGEVAASAAPPDPASAAMLERLRSRRGEEEMPDDADGSLLEGDEEEVVSASEPPRSNVGRADGEEGGDAPLAESAGPQRRSALLLAALILGAYLRLRSGTAALLVATELAAVGAFVSRAAAAVASKR